MISKIPTGALILGLSGVIPFGWGAVTLVSEEAFNFGIENTLLLNKLKLFNDNELQILNSRSCPRREPLYTHYKVFGNIIIMAEPLNTEDEKDTTKFIENLASKLLE